MSVPLSDTRLTVRAEILAALSRAGAFCGECGFQPGDTGCGDCVRVRGLYADAVMPTIDRLRAESESRRQAAAANAASIEVLQRQINKQAGELDRLGARLNKAEAAVRAVETVKCWTNEDGRRFVFAEDLAYALGYTPTTAAPVRNCFTDEAYRSSLTDSPRKPCLRAQPHPTHKHVVDRASWQCPGVAAPTS